MKWVPTKVLLHKCATHMGFTCRVEQVQADILFGNLEQTVRSVKLQFHKG